MGVLDILSLVLDKIIKCIRYEACWAVSNIMATKPEIIQVVLDHKDLLQKAFKLYHVDEIDVSSFCLLFMR